MASTVAANIALSAEQFETVIEDDLNASRIPRRRGFNLQGDFAEPGRTQSHPAFDEFDFAAMAEWGFDFARLPLSYWGRKDDWTVINKGPLSKTFR